MISAGKLNRKIDIINPVEVKSSLSGELITTWSTYIKNRWAMVIPLSGRELFTASQYKAEVDTTFIIRYSSGVKPDMRVVYNESSYYISNIIDPNDDHKELQILTRRIST